MIRLELFKIVLSLESYYLRNELVNLFVKLRERQFVE